MPRRSCSPVRYSGDTRRQISLRDLTCAWRREIPKQNAPQTSLFAERSRLFWRRPIFPEGCPSSIVGASGFHFRVRDGNGWATTAMTTRNCALRLSATKFVVLQRILRRVRMDQSYLPDLSLDRFSSASGYPGGKTRPVSREELYIKALGHLVRVSSTCHHAYTSRLSTR